MDERIECPNCHVFTVLEQREFAALIGRNREAALRALQVEEKARPGRFGFRTELAEAEDGRRVERWTKTG